MYGIVKRQIDFFLQGFYEIISKDLISIFSYNELEVLIAGLPDLDGKYNPTFFTFSAF